MSATPYLSISKKLAKTAEEQLTTVNGKLQYGFPAFNYVVDKICEVFRKSTAIKRGEYKLYLYSDHHGYDSIHTYSKTVVRCIAVVKNGVIREMTFERYMLGGKQTVFDSVYTNDVQTRATHLARFLEVNKDFIYTNNCDENLDWRKFVENMHNFRVRPVG